MRMSERMSEELVYCKENAMEVMITALLKYLKTKESVLVGVRERLKGVHRSFL